jgi:hypothetical protein
MSTQLKTLYRRAVDFITFVKLEAPDFAPEDKLTFQTAIARLRRNLDDVREAENNEVALRWLKLCERSIAKGESFFAVNQDSEGRKALDTARTYLINASSRKSTDPSFVAGESGPWQDLNSGFPT